MKQYIKLNEERWNKVENSYTEPLSRQEFEIVKNQPLNVGLTVGKAVPTEWFEKNKVMMLAMFWKKELQSHFYRRWMTMILTILLVL